MSTLQGAFQSIPQRRWIRAGSHLGQLHTLWADAISHIRGIHSDIHCHDCCLQVSRAEAHLLAIRQRDCWCTGPLLGVQRLRQASTRSTWYASRQQSRAGDSFWQEPLSSHSCHHPTVVPIRTLGWTTPAGRNHNQPINQSSASIRSRPHEMCLRRWSRSSLWLCRTSVSGLWHACLSARQTCSTPLMVSARCKRLLPRSRTSAPQMLAHVDYRHTVWADLRHPRLVPGPIQVARTRPTCHGGSVPRRLDGRPQPSTGAQHTCPRPEANYSRSCGGRNEWLTCHSWRVQPR
jgi:hypothetical protein